MQQISEILSNPKADCRESTTYDHQAYLRRKCEDANRLPGSLKGYDCPDCMNRGGYHDVKAGYEAFRPCKCMGVRNAMKNAERSGLGKLLDSCTFDSFETKTDWQRSVKLKAQAFLSDNDGKWFLFCGQVGSGKTHLCTAIVGAMLKAGRAARYMRWKDESTRLKALVNEAEYGKAIEPWKRTSVLYIDDLFKVQKGKVPSQGDINVAYEILSHRYTSPSLVTIISCEHTLEQLMDFDEAVGSRIYERSKEYCTVILPDKTKNQRLKGN